MKFAWEALTKSAVLYQLSFSETGLENSREIGRFFREFVPENPAKFDFFSATYQKPWRVLAMVFDRFGVYFIDIDLISPSTKIVPALLQ